MSRTYKELLDENGLSFSFGHVKWYTTKFNRCFFHWGKQYPSLARAWFTVGACFGVCMMVVSVVILSWTLAQAFMKSSPEKVLTPVVSLSLWTCCVFYKYLELNLLLLNPY